MSWVKLDDGFTDHPKIARVGVIGAWIQLQALCYANKNLTDGFIPFGVARSFATRSERIDGDGRVWEVGETHGMQGVDADEIDWPALLVEAGLWEQASGGYRIHDYDQYQRSKAEVLALRAHAVTRQQRWRARHSVTHNVNNGVVNTPPSPSPIPSPRSQKKKNTLASLACATDDTFDQFWNAYPLHTGKQAARKAWKKLGPDPPLPAILAALTWQRQLDRWREDGGRYVPHPATYLNGRRWEDEPPTNAAATHAATVEAIKAEGRRKLREGTL